MPSQNNYDKMNDIIGFIIPIVFFATIAIFLVVCIILWIALKKRWCKKMTIIVSIVFLGYFSVIFAATKITSYILSKNSGSNNNDGFLITRAANNRDIAISEFDINFEKLINGDRQLDELFVAEAQTNVKNLKIQIDFYTSQSVIIKSEQVYYGDINVGKLVAKPVSFTAYQVVNVRRYKYTVIGGTCYWFNW